jgi:ketosteroid isomerase-like protein
MTEGIDPATAVQRTILDYVYSVDRGRMDDLLDLFTSDAIIETGGTEHRGRAAIASLFEETGKTLADGAASRIAHHVTVVHVDVDGDTASALSYFASFLSHGVDHWGRYRDTLRCIDGHWKFARRVTLIDGRTPGGWADSLENWG